MLRVRIAINTSPLVDTNAVRIKTGKAPYYIHTYQLPDGRTFRHRYEDGAVILAIKILKRTEEPKCI